MHKFCAAVIPTRNTVENLTRALRSFFGSANYPGELEAVLRIDNDNAQTIKAIPDLAREFAIKTFIGPRYSGYSSMGRFVTEAAGCTDADWLFLLDDDAEIVGDGWDEKLMALPIKNCAGQPQFYHLNKSKYGSGSCGPVGLFVPNKFWKTLGHDQCTSPVDDFWLNCITGLHWKIHLLQGIIYRHHHHQAAHNPS